MQLSHFLKVYPYAERPGHLLLYSTKKTSLILLKENTFQKIEQGALSPSDEARLKKLGMVVDDREEEKRAVLNLFDDLNANNPEVNIIVVLNLDCNFSCIYCYEGEMKGHLYMSAETGDLLVDFIKEKLGVEVQFGKYAFMAYDVFAKMPIFAKNGKITAGIEIIPMWNLAQSMSTGVSHFEMFKGDLEMRGVSSLDIPVMIIGIDVKGTKKRTLESFFGADKSS